jgi:hypothetical protein
MTGTLSALRVGTDAATPRSAAPPAPFQDRPRPTTMPSAPVYQSAGEIVGRRDLSDDAVLRAVAERLAFERRDPAQAKVVLDAALAGKAIAVNFVRSLALPMPSAPLEMPVQPLLAERPPKGPGRRRFAFLPW